MPSTLGFVSRVLCCAVCFCPPQIMAVSDARQRMTVQGITQHAPEESGEGERC
jgi:hypothetical protein